MLASCLSTWDLDRDTPEKNQRSVAVGPSSLYDEKGSSVIVSSDSLKTMDESLKPLEQHGASMKDQFQTRAKLLSDEEDVAALLANQLAKEEMEMSYKPDDTGGSELELPVLTKHAQAEKFDCELKDESKGLYKGKIRNIFRCSVEGCSFKSHMKKDLDRHGTVHTGERPFKCLTCGKAFTRSDKLLLHQRIHSGDKRYKCSKCAYASVDSGSLIKHLRVHNEERPFRCLICPYRSRDSSQLTVHMRSHTGDSPFVCTNEKCRRPFKTRSDLKRHMAVHLSVKPHACHICPYKSTFKGNLQLHIQNHHPDGKSSEYKCTHCQLDFPTLRKLKNHVQKCSNVHIKSTGDQVEAPKYEKKRKKPRTKGDVVGTLAKVFNCHQCDSSFVCWASLQTHEKYHRKTKEKLETALEIPLKNSERFYRQMDNMNEVERNEDMILTMNTHVEKQEVGDDLLGGDTYIVENISLENVGVFHPSFSSSAVHDFVELVPS